MIREGVSFHQMREQNERGDRVEQRVVPRLGGDQRVDGFGQSVGLTKRAERVVRQLRPGGAGEQQGVDPRAEAMAGEGAEEALFRAFAMGDDDRAGETAFEFRPQQQQGRGVGEILRADAVDFPRGPLDRLVGEKVGHERVGVPRFRGPTGEPDLDRAVGSSPRRAGRFEIDGGESAVADERHEGGISPEGEDQASSARADGSLTREAMCVTSVNNENGDDTGGPASLVEVDGGGGEG